jgi:hypothetical protein
MIIENLIERMAQAIHAVRVKKEGSGSLTWQDCIPEAEAAYAAVNNKPYTYDPKADYSHLEPI